MAYAPTTSSFGTPKLPSKACGLAKVLTSWNGLMLAAFAETARLLDRDDYREVAEHNAALLLNELRRDGGRLHRSWKDGESKLNGYLKDHSYLIEGLLELYQTTFDPRWFVAAQELAAPCSLTSRHLKACSWRRRANC